MSLRTSTVTNKQKLEAVEALLAAEDIAHRRYSKPLNRARLDALKCIAGEIRARMQAREGRARADVGRQLDSVLASPAAPNYEQGALAQLAYIVIRHWPGIRQALEAYEREPAE